MATNTITSNNHEMAVTNPSTSIFSAIGTAVKAIRVHAERRRSERALREMDPRLLKDIGIDRSEIMSVVYTGSRDRR